jgi:hypothetical protein
VIPTSPPCIPRLVGMTSTAGTPTGVHDTRPGGPNRQERAHRVGAPESPTEAIEEIGMLQVHTHVSVHCGQCGDALGSPGFEAHYPTEAAALGCRRCSGLAGRPG